MVEGLSRGLCCCCCYSADSQVFVLGQSFDWKCAFALEFACFAALGFGCLDSRCLSVVRTPPGRLLTWGCLWRSCVCVCESHAFVSVKVMRLCLWRSCVCVCEGHAFVSVKFLRLCGWCDMRTVWALNLPLIYCYVCVGVYVFMFMRPVRVCMKLVGTLIRFVGWCKCLWSLWAC